MFHISKNKCAGCGICKSLCSKIIEIDNGLAVIKIQNEECLRKAEKACPQKAIKEIKENLIIAIGTDDEKTIKADDHFGMSKYFQIWKYSNGELKFIETRKNLKVEEDEKRIHGDQKKANATSSVLEGINVIIGKMMGPNLIRLKNKFVIAIIREQEIKKSLNIIKDSINEILEEKEKEQRRVIILN